MTFKCRPFVVLSMHIAMVSGEYPHGGRHRLRGLPPRRSFGPARPRDHHHKKPQTADAATTGCERASSPLAQSAHGLHAVYGKHALTELRRLHQVKPVDVVHTLLPLVSWTAKEYLWVEEHIAPVVSASTGVGSASVKA